MNRIIYLVLLAIFSRVASGSTPSCLGEACIDRKPLNEVEISKKFGKFYSKTISKYDNSSNYCFKLDSKEGTFYLEVIVGDSKTFSNFSGMKYSSAKICINDKPTHVKNKLQTSEGITLGSTVEDLLKTYGKPTWHEKTPVKAHYDDFFGAKSKFEVDSIICFAAGEKETLASLFYISKGVVVGIEISTSP